jgi:hypothetical protein
MCPPFVRAGVSTDVDRRFGSFAVLGFGKGSESVSTFAGVSRRVVVGVVVVGIGLVGVRSRASSRRSMSTDGSGPRRARARRIGRIGQTWNRMNATLSVSSHIIIRTALVCV